MPECTECDRLEDLTVLLTPMEVGIARYDQGFVLMGGLMAVVGAAVMFAGQGALFGSLTWPLLAAAVNEYRASHPLNADADMLNLDQEGQVLLRQAAQIRREWQSLVLSKPGIVYGRGIYAMSVSRRIRDWHTRYKALKMRAVALQIAQQARLQSLRDEASRLPMTE